MSTDLQRFHALTPTTLDATLLRDGEQATIALAGQGDREQLQLSRLEADTPGGGLRGRARPCWFWRVTAGWPRCSKKWTRGWNCWSAMPPCFARC